MIVIEVIVTVLDVIEMVVASWYPEAAGRLRPPDSTHQNHEHPAPLAKSLAKTGERALEP